MSDKGMLAIAKFLASTNVDINEGLLKASQEGYLSIVKYLLQKGADVNTKNVCDETALILAAGRGHLEIVKYLINKGADESIKDYFGRTALNVAKIDEIKEFLINLTNVDLDKQLLVHIIAGNLDAIKQCLSNGASINAKNDYNYTTLMLAAREGHLEIVKYLIESGADVNMSSGNGGFTPLMLASNNGHIEVVKLLMDNGALVGVKNEFNETALDLAMTTEIRKCINDRVKYAVMYNARKYFNSKNIVLDIVGESGYEKTKQLVKLLYLEDTLFWRKQVESEMIPFLAAVTYNLSNNNFNSNMISSYQAKAVNFMKNNEVFIAGLQIAIFSGHPMEYCIEIAYMMIDECMSEDDFYTLMNKEFLLLQITYAKDIFS